MKQLGKITSRDNSKLKAVRRVRDGKDKSKIFIEGGRLVEEAIRSNIGVTETYVSESFIEKGSDRASLRLHVTENNEVTVLPEPLFRSISDTENPQGILAIANRLQRRSLCTEVITLDDRTCPVVVFLNGINNPSNLGAVLRAAEAAGVLGVAVSKDSADVYSPKALRASMGSAFRIRIWTGHTVADAIACAKRLGMTSVAADIEGNVPYVDVDWTKPRLLIFGSEAQGLEPAEKEMADSLTFIPMQNRVESLNLAVSAGIIMFEARRQLDASRR